MSKGGRKKPISKKVLFNLESLQRRRGIRDLENRFLIVCEDGKSAPNYFEALKKHFYLSATSIQIVGGGGRTQPTQVVARAIQIKQLAASSNSGTEPFGQVWCVIDGDYGNRISNARTSAQANGIELAVSTMCFEYWILLHFEENNSSTNDCDEMVRRLKGSYLSDYEKGKCDFLDVVAKVDDACARAEKLRRPGITRGDLPEGQNPSSEVYRLIKALQTSGA
jgi:hypothetical protein